MEHGDERVACTRKDRGPDVGTCTAACTFWPVEVGRDRSGICGLDLHQILYHFTQFARPCDL